MQKKPSEPDAPARPSSPIPALILLALVLRMAAAFAYGVNFNEPQSHTFGDTKEYCYIALNLAMSGKMFLEKDGRLYYASRPPVYPMFLAALWKLPEQYFVRALVVSQSLIGALTCWLVYRLARMKFSERAARLAFLACAVYPFFIFYAGLMLTETLFCFFFVLAVLFLEKAAARFGWLWAALAGAALGLGALTRGEFIAFPLVALPVWVLARENKKRRLAQALLALAFMAAVIAPWAARNAGLFGDRLILTSTRLGHDLYEGNNPDADGGFMADRIDWDKTASLPPKIYESEESREIAENNALAREALNWIKNNPGKFISLIPAKEWRTWRPVPAYGEFKSWYFVLLSIVSYAPVVILAAAGVWLLRRQVRGSVMTLVVPVIYVALIHCVFIGSLRYNLPAMPFLIILAAAVVDRLFAKTTNKGV